MIRPVSLAPPMILAPAASVAPSEPIPAPAAAVTFAPAAKRPSAEPAAQHPAEPSAPWVEAAKPQPLAESTEPAGVAAPSAAEGEPPVLESHASEPPDPEEHTEARSVPHSLQAPPAADDPAIPESSAAETTAPPGITPQPRAPDEHLARIAAELTALPGVAGCLLFSREGEVISSGDFPPLWSSDLVRGMAFETDSALRRRNSPSSGDVTQFAIQSSDFPVHFFVHGDACVCAFLSARVFLPGVREKLAAASATAFAPRN
jgi:hypothetical protein